MLLFPETYVKLKVFGNEMITPTASANQVFEDLMSEYFAADFFRQSDPNTQEWSPADVVDEKLERRWIADFLSTPCSCGRNCQSQFFAEEVFRFRADFRLMSWESKNSFILSQLRSAMRSSTHAVSGRKEKPRARQRFEYRISLDREVCREVFLFYHGETISRLKHLQKHVVEVGISPPRHGNVGWIPTHACPDELKTDVKCFIRNFAMAHGMPDPGRDVRKGKGKLRLLLPAMLNYTAVYRVFKESSQHDISYRTFLRIWHDVASYICFSKPRSDLCMRCEDFKKRLNQLNADLTEEAETKKITVYREALAHIEHARRERNHYRQCIKISEQNYSKIDIKQRMGRVQANSRAFPMHYSWDFAQQLHYPFEDQQVGPIYFKTPRRAQVFGVCCEGIPRQVNYLIDEADFFDKGSNTVISLLDHFFTHHGVGEKQVFLTADNCVAQNKNNALLHYLMYRTLVGLHSEISLSFMVVGHTKFAPDGYFGLIKKRYRRSKTYTYDHLAHLIDESCEQNQCQRYHDKHGNICFKYRDWTTWLSQYFRKLPNLTTYYHFHLDSDNPGVIKVKAAIDGKEQEHDLRKKPFPYSKDKRPRRLPTQLAPEALSAERQWYLYEKIREHIPSEKDQDATCPKPDIPKTHKD